MYYIWTSPLFYISHFLLGSANSYTGDVETVQFREYTQWPSIFWDPLSTYSVKKNWAHCQVFTARRRADMLVCTFCYCWNEHFELTMIKVLIIKYHNLEWRTIYYNAFTSFLFWLFIENDSKGFRSQQVITGPDNGLTLNRWQAITWANDNSVPWLIYTRLNADELIGIQYRWFMIFSALCRCMQSDKDKFSTWIISNK